MIHDIRFDKPFLDMAYPCPVCYGGKKYPTALHAFYSVRAADPYMKATLSCGTIGYLKNVGPKAVPVPGWEKDRYAVLYGILEAKFRDPSMAAMLASAGTGPVRALNTSHENLWGACACPLCSGRGMDVLGRMLTALRDKTA